MDDPEFADAWMAKAIALMTAWNESDDGDTTFASETLVSYLRDAADTDGLVDELTELTTGLMSLCGRLLVALESRTSLTSEQWLQAMAKPTA